MTSGAHLVVKTGACRNPPRTVEIRGSSDISRVGRNGALAKFLKYTEHRLRMRSVRANVVNSAINNNTCERREQEQADHNETDARQMPSNSEDFWTCDASILQFSFSRRKPIPAVGVCPP